MPPAGPRTFMQGIFFTLTFIEARNLVRKKLPLQGRVFTNNRRLQRSLFFNRSLLTSAFAVSLGQRLSMFPSCPPTLPSALSSCVNLLENFNLRPPTKPTEQKTRCGAQKLVIVTFQWFWCPRQVKQFWPKRFTNQQQNHYFIELFWAHYSGKDFFILCWIFFLPEHLFPHPQPTPRNKVHIPWEGNKHMLGKPLLGSIFQKRIIIQKWKITLLVRTS